MWEREARSAGALKAGLSGCRPGKRLQRCHGAVLRYARRCSVQDADARLSKRLPPRPDAGAPSRRALRAAQAGAAYVEAFETVLKNVAKDETVQYVLALLEEMLEGGWVQRVQPAGGRGGFSGAFAHESLGLWDGGLSAPAAARSEAQPGGGREAGARVGGWAGGGMWPGAAELLFGGSGEVGEREPRLRCRRCLSRIPTPRRAL